MAAIAHLMDSLYLDDALLIFGGARIALSYREMDGHLNVRIISEIDYPEIQDCNITTASGKLLDRRTSCR